MVCRVWSRVARNLTSISSFPRVTPQCTHRTHGYIELIFWDVCVPLIPQPFKSNESPQANGDARPIYSIDPNIHRHTTLFRTFIWRTDPRKVVVVLTSGQFWHRFSVARCNRSTVDNVDWSPFAIPLSAFPLTVALILHMFLIESNSFHVHVTVLAVQLLKLTYSCKKVFEKCYFSQVGVACNFWLKLKYELHILMY